MKLNQYQKVFLETYAQGEYDHPDLDPGSMGDGLAEFLLRELGEEWDDIPMEYEVAISRMETVAEQVAQVLEALRNIETPPIPDRDDENYLVHGLREEDLP